MPLILNGHLVHIPIKCNIKSIFVELPAQFPSEQRTQAHPVVFQ